MERELGSRDDFVICRMDCEDSGNQNRKHRKKELSDFQKSPHTVREWQ